MTPLFGQGIFQTPANATPEQLERRRALMAALMPRFGSAKYVGEGLGQLATGVVMGRQNRALEKRESEGAAEAGDLFQRVVGGVSARQPGGNSGFSVLGQAPASSGGGSGGSMPTAASRRLDPDNPLVLANDVMKTLGRSDMVWNDNSLAKMDGVSPDLVNVMKETRRETGIPFEVTEGLRNADRQRQLVAQGASQTMNSKHLTGNALDIHIPDGQGGANWNFEDYRPIGEAAKSVAARKGLDGFTWGGDWKTLRDGVHFQLDGQGQPQRQNDPTAQPPFEVQQYADAGPSEAALLELMTHPFASEQQRAVAGQMLAQRRQMADPGYAMGLEKQRLELEQMRNPQPDMTATQREYDMARAQGYDGTFMDYKRDLAQASRPQTNINNNMGGDGEPRPQLLGTQGLVAIPDPNSETGYRVVPAEGSPLARDNEAEAKKDEMRRGLAQASSDVVINSASRAREAAKSRVVGGLLGTLASKNPSSQNAEIYRQVGTLQSMAAAENINAMRQASPTGGALGNASDADILLLKQKSGALDPASPNFERDLDDYERTLLRTIHGTEAGDEIFKQTRAAQTGGMDFGGMSLNDLLNVDVNSLSPADLEAMQRRFDEVSQ
jgi:hypothetical protein